jgi:transcriptional regulator with XRE-family HTH domain
VALATEKALGRVLKALRLKRGLTQEELSFACKRHPTYIRILESGKSSPTVKTLFALAKALEVDPSEIIKEVEKALRK